MARAARLQEASWFAPPQLHPRLQHRRAPLESRPVQPSHCLFCLLAAWALRPVGFVRCCCHLALNGRSFSLSS